jgi:hypothetical protein
MLSLIEQGFATSPRLLESSMGPRLRGDDVPWLPIVVQALACTLSMGPGFRRDDVHSALSGT